MRRILLFHNSPRVRRYFTSLARHIRTEEILTSNIFGRLGGSPPAGTIEEIIDYGMRRKAARLTYGPARLALFRTAYSLAARLHYDRAAEQIETLRPDAVGVWGGNAVDAMAVVVAARHAGLPCFHFENGFLPNTTQMDLAGVNAQSSVPRDPEFYRARGGTFDTGSAAQIVPRKPRRRKAGQPSVTLPQRYFFVPFQVKLDSQVLLHSPWIQRMEDLFDVVTAAVARLGADAPHVVFKEHPSCPTRYADIYRRVESMPRVSFANGNATGELIAGSLGIITLNSSVGIESLLLGKPVLALGDAAFTIPGVAESARSSEAITAWARAVASGTPPAAPLREAFLSYLAEEHLIPDRHQQPGPRHFAAVRAKIQLIAQHSRDASTDSAAQQHAERLSGGIPSS